MPIPFLVGAIVSAATATTVATTATTVAAAATTAAVATAAMKDYKNEPVETKEKRVISEEEAQKYLKRKR